MKQVQTNKQIEVTAPLAELFPDLLAIESRLKRLAPVSPVDITIPLTFSMAFGQIFLSEMPNYQIKKDAYGATRSNWTYHTALAIAQTCKMINLTCRFEALGKRDAVIETRTEPIEVVLICEWEWDYEDIFGTGKELEKLLASCAKHDVAEGFLLTYCPSTKYEEYLEKVADTWIGGTRPLKLPPSLFLHTIIFGERSGFREFERLRTVAINSNAINVWNDLFF